VAQREREAARRAAAEGSNRSVEDPPDEG